MFQLSLVFCSDKTGHQELYVISRESKDLEWGTPRQLTFDGGSLCRWSPDGRLIAFISGNSLRVISPEGGNPQVLVSSQDPVDLPVPGFPAWSLDARIVYYKGRDVEGRSSFWSVPALGGTPEIPRPVEGF